MATKVKVKRERGTTRISRKNQITLPVATLRVAGLRPGDRLKVGSTEPGRVVLERDADPLMNYAGALTGAYPKGYLRKLRAEWR